MASTSLSDISRPDSDSSEATTASITDVEHLSSYSWVEASVPTISVPGCPALWLPPKTPQRVFKDSGLIYIAQNAARHPDSPLEPLFRSLYIENPSFDIRSVDLVTDRNNIRKLLSFIDPKLSKNGLETFTIKVEIVGDTAIFCRTETETTMTIGPNEFRGYGHEFEKAYTIDCVDGITGHHRIISYQFGGMKFVVRYEADGYVGTASKQPNQETRLGNDNLSGMMESLSLLPPKDPGYPASPNSKLVVKEEGKTAPTSSILEIKTRVFYKHIDIEEVLPQLWVSQTPNLVRAYHKHGLFEKPEVEDVTGQIKGWEEKQQENLTKLATLIKRIIKVVKESGGRADVKYDPQSDKLLVGKGDGRGMLPGDLYSKFDATESAETESNADSSLIVEPGSPRDDY